MAAGIAVTQSLENKFHCPKSRKIYTTWLSEEYHSTIQRWFPPTFFFLFLSAQCGMCPLYRWTTREVLVHFLKLFIYLSLTALGLCCCARSFSSCDAWGSSLWWLLISQSTGSRVCGRQDLWCTGLVALQHVESTRTREQTCVPYIGR